MLCGVVALAGCDSDAKQLDQDASSATACECELTWEVDSVVPCIAPPSISLPSIIFSSHADEPGGDADSIPDCNAAQDFPQPVPSEPWSKHRIRASCAGSVNLCVALKHGKADSASESDCTVMEHCFETAYDVAGKVLELPALPGWSATDGECSNQFHDEGGYVEFRGEGELGCEGKPRVKRVQLCPSECATDPDSSVCKNCGNAGLSSDF